MELIKQMVRSVIKTYLKLGIILFLSLGFQNGYSHKVTSLDKEQHLVINSIFKYSSEKQIMLNKKTLEYESWMDFIRTSDFEDLEIIGYCSINDPEFEQEFKDFKNEMLNLETKKINSKELDSKFKVKKTSSKNVSAISEPLIINEYSFQFIKSFYGKALNVQKKNDQGNWDYACGIYFPSDLQ